MHAHRPLAQHNTPVPSYLYYRHVHSQLGAHRSAEHRNCSPCRNGATPFQHALLADSPRLTMITSRLPSLPCPPARLQHPHARPFPKGSSSRPPLHVVIAAVRSGYDYDYNMAPQRGRPYRANLGSMGRNTRTWSIRSDCLSNITSWSRRKGIKNTTLPFIPQ